MRSVLYVAALGLVCFVAIWAYQVINDTRVLLDDVDRLHARIASEREAISVLRAEWAWLNRPERLAMLVERNAEELALAPMTPEVFGAATSVAFQPPPPHAPGPAPEAPGVPDLAVFAMAGGPLGRTEAGVATSGPAAPAPAPDAAEMASDSDADLAPAGPIDPPAAASGPAGAPAFDAPAPAPEIGPADAAGALVAGLSPEMRRDLGAAPAPAPEEDAPVQVAALDPAPAETPAAMPAAMTESDLIQSLVLQAQGWMPPPRPAGR